MIVDKGDDFPTSIEQDLLRYGSDMWHFRVHPNCQTTRAINAYRGEHRSFEYKSSLPRLSPKDLKGTTFAKPSALHFVCSAARALAITAEIKQEQGWNPVTIYEPIDVRQNTLHYTLGLIDFSIDASQKNFRNSNVY